MRYTQDIRLSVHWRGKMNKSGLRESAIQKLKKLSDSDKKTIEQQLLHRLIHTNSWINARTVGITVSQGIEWNTTNIIEKAWEEDKTICAPKCYPKQRTMDFYRLQSFQDLEIVYYNLKEPKPIPENKKNKAELDLLIVPGLLFDANGFRIGFGGGYYDRFLSDYKGRTVALTSSFQMVDYIPKESFDIAVDQIVTEKEIIDVKG